MLSRPQRHNGARRIKSVEKSNDLIGNRTRELPACSVVPQQTTLPSAPKGKAIPVAGHGGPPGFETSRISHFLDNRHTDGGKAVSLMRRPPFTPRKIPGTHFCQKLSRHKGHNAAGRIRSIEKYTDLIDNRTRDIAACSKVPQPTTLPQVPVIIDYI
jgi:hypothetical protein